MVKVDISLVVPCFDEESTVPVFYEEAVKVCKTLNKQFEIIFVDDGSMDGTLKILQNLAQQDDCVHFISFSRNFGKEAALLAGLQAAQGDYIATIDVDG